MSRSIWNFQSRAYTLFTRNISKHIFKATEFDGTEYLVNKNKQFYEKFIAIADKYKNHKHKEDLIKAYVMGLNDTTRNQIQNVFLNRKKKNWLPWILIILFGYDAYRLIKGSVTGKNNIFMPMFEKDNLVREKIDVKFDDVIGCDEVKKELQSLVRFLKHPTEFIDIGARLPKGALLIGPPGVGKTLLAKAVAGEAEVAFFYISGSEIDEVFVGLGASRIRKLFQKAKEQAPCVIFIDELDSLCRRRDMESSDSSASSQTVNQILAEMDGFKGTDGVVVMGATNNLGALDPAAIRAGRFDTHVRVHKPDCAGRAALFEYYLGQLNSVDRDKKSPGGIDVSSLARATIGYSGADISNLVNQAAILCVLRGDAAVGMTHLWDADTKIRMGAVRAKPQDSETNRTTAIIEAGRAIVAYYSPDSADRLKAITVIPRGQRLGHSSFVPKVEDGYRTKAQLQASLDILLASRVAEQMHQKSDNISTAVERDVQRAAHLASRMVRQLTMSPTLHGSPASPRLLVQESESVRCRYCHRLSMGPRLRAELEKETATLLQMAQDRARTLLERHRARWLLLADWLEKLQTLEATDIQVIIEHGSAPLSSGSGVDKTSWLQTVRRLLGAGR